VKYILRIVVFLVILWLGFYLNSIWSRSDLEKKLVANFQPNTLVKLDSLIGEKEGLVCVMGEYTDGIGEYKDAPPEINKDAHRINAYLKKIDFYVGEFDSALIIATKDKIQTFEFNHLLGVKFVNYRHMDRVILPTNFESAKWCIALKDAYFYQTIVKYDSLYPFTSKEGVKSIILGSKKQ